MSHCQNHLCRNCYELFRFEQVGILCRSRACSQVLDDRRRRGPRYFSSQEYGFWKGLFRKRLVLDDQTPCPFCAEPKLEKACPLCRAPLDATAGQVDDHVIAVVGASESGKSHYLAAVLYQFLERQVGGDTWSVRFAGDEDEDTYRREFLEPLFERREELPATPLGERPELRLLLENRRTGTRALLAFRDLAGETFVDPHRLERNRFLRHAQGVVLVVDPQAFPLDTLSGVQPWIPNGRPTAVDVLAGYRKVLQRQDRPPELLARPVMPEDKLLAVAVTKADLVLAPGHSFYADGGADPLQSGYWNARREQDQRVRDWLRNHINGRLERETERFADAGFFFVSSYGFRHQPRSPLENKPSPLRVEEPILALLDRLAAESAGPSGRQSILSASTEAADDHF